jgi:hypothetical protein
MPKLPRKRNKAQAKPKATATPRKSTPKVHPSVKAAQELGLDVSPAERHFLENSQNVPTEGNPLQGRTF